MVRKSLRAKKYGWRNKMTGVIKVQDKAKDFVLKDQNGVGFKLSEFRGKRVLLSFHPLAWTGVCAKQMQSLEKNFDEFEGLGAVAVGINIDHVPSKLAWAKSLDISKTRLLSDFWPHGKVARSLGLFREKNGFSERANVILDGAGKVIFVKVYEMKVLPDISEILGFLRGSK